MTYDLTCVITGHREGRLSVASLRSFDIAINYAEEQGLRVERIYCLDTTNELTKSLFESYKDKKSKLHLFDLRDQGLVRNAAVAKAKGKYIAFLDADDLWSRTWLWQAVEFLRSQKSKSVIAHPAYNYFFENQATIYCHIDQSSNEFDIDHLRLSNYWDALCVCETKIYKHFPFAERAIDKGWAYEDWFWNCETVAAKIQHVVVPETILFKRRQENSQTIKASANKSLTRVHDLTLYNAKIYQTGKR